jgi:transposase InsO family protein
MDGDSIVTINAVTRANARKSSEEQEEVPILKSEDNVVSIDNGIAVNNLKELQNSDDILSYFIEGMKIEGSKPPWNEIAHKGAEFKAYWALWDCLIAQDNILYKVVYSNGGAIDQLRIVLPKALKNDVLYQLHGSRSSGHLGQHKTIEKVRERFYWYRYKEDVIDWCQRCDECAKAKMPPVKNRGEMKIYNVGMPLERVCVDILGPLPRSAKGNKYLLVITDCFTKWVEAIPMRNQEAITVAKKFVDEFITRFGTPKQIHTDQGTQFESKLFQELCRLLEIDKTRTTPWHPESDGQVERFNRTLENMLRMFVEESQKDWDQYIPYVLMAYRSSVHESTKRTPNMLMFGREIDLPLDVAFGLPNNHVFGTEEYCQTLRERLEDSFEYVRDALQKSAERRKRYYDTSRRGKQYEEGELVWLFNPQRKIGKSPKLQKCWSGPFKIVKKLNDILYQIRKRDKLKVVHYNNLKRYHSKTLEVKKECNIVKEHAENIEPGRSDESPDLYLCESSDEDISTAGV